MRKLSFLFAFILFIFCKSQYHDVANYSTRSTPINGLKIKTNLPFSTFQMPSIILEGYAYGARKSIGIIINYYIYQGEFHAPTSQISSYGSFSPKITLANEDGKVVIFMEDKIYFVRFSVRASGSENPEYYKNWSIVDEPLYGDKRLTLPYKNNYSEIYNSNFNINGSLSSSIDSDEGGSLTLHNPRKHGNTNHAYRWVLYNMTGKYGNSLQFWNYSSDHSMRTARLIISDNGNMSLPTGKFEAKEVKVTTTPTADFVFAEDYRLPKLEEIEKHIRDKKHLPEIASATQMEKEGVNIGEFQIKLLQKIEELTLYTIELNKQNKELKKRIEKLKNKNNHEGYCFYST
ncbi:hypothetical protein OKE68_06335, partial [Riemerella anatipestifer]